MEKTVVQRIIDWTVENARSITDQNGVTHITIDHEEFRKEFDTYLDKERKQIINAGNTCISDWVNYDPERHGNEAPSGEQYYSQRYQK